MLETSDADDQVDKDEREALEDRTVETWEQGDEEGVGELDNRLPVDKVVAIIGKAGGAAQDLFCA